MKPEDWILSGDTGISSKTIWAVMMGAQEENVLLYFPDAMEPRIFIGFRFADDDEELSWYPDHETTLHGKAFDVEPTHWMPLPEPPKEAP